jgi:hypothetical protein
MKTKLVIAAATVAGALLVKYFMNRVEAARQHAIVVPPKKTHHLTDVFAHAKNHVEQL